ncbi:hypothetical protein NQ314_016487 [Rhamnusium bicolor]|uniref:Regulatory protein zeste n=1 Tax=Rhamnusium bicolor TaxID=1586634 RepID=A0AAV8WWT1_9CUCU|nr:hypothetical protein NQ314_016487 [Rhamnusium bicolor]
MFIVDMIQKHIPELCLNNAKEIFTCVVCQNSLENLSNFIMKCLDVEERIKGNVGTGSDIPLKLDDNAQDVKLSYEDNCNRMSLTEIKPNCDAGEENITIKCEIKDENLLEKNSQLGIENEEILIKSEQRDCERMEQCTLSKACRSANFTASEKHHLFNLISNKYGHILEHKKTDRSSVAQKFMTSKQIERGFNADSPNSVFRTAECLKNSMKIKKIRIEEKNRECLLEGAYLYKRLDLAISIMNEKTLHGSHNEYDSDRATGPIKNGNVEIEYILDNEQEENYAECSLMDDSSINTVSNSGPSSHGGDKENMPSTSTDHSDKDVTWKHYNPADLKSPINPALRVHYSSTPSTKNKQSD